MITVDVRADIRQAQLFLRATEKGMSRAISRALNRTATMVRTEAARLIKQKRDLPIGVIKENLKVVKSTPNYLVSEVRASGKAISIRHFARHGKRGVTVRIEPGGKRVMLMKYGNKAFINPVWRPGVFVRTTRARLPIKAWPAVAGFPFVFVQTQIVEAMKRVVNTAFPARLRHELDYEVRKAKAAAGATGPSTT